MNKLLTIALMIGGAWIGDQLIDHGQTTAMIVSAVMRHLS